MADLPAWVFSFAAGIAIGVFYFGLLWLTVQRLATIRHPGLVVFVSFALRTVIALLAFFVVSDGQWLRLVLSLAGFVLARFALVRFLGMHSYPSSE